MLARTDSRTRALVLLLIVTLLSGAIGARLVWWQVIERDRLATMAMQQLAQRQEIPAGRGEIFDANGIMLATSVELQSIFATPTTLRDADDRRAWATETAGVLAPLLGFSEEELAAKLDSGRHWVWVSRRVEPHVSDRVRELGLKGIGMLPETRRVYPVTGPADGTTLAAQVLGYVNVDGAGQYGIEGAENRLLAGSPGFVTAQEDVAGRRIADSVYELQPPVDGKSLTLTIDAGVQHLLEAVLWDTYRTNKAKGATGIVMDPRSGAILGMANYPSFDANQYATTDPALFLNQAVSRQYEPGSVMKAFTVAAALETGAVDVDDTFVDDNNLVLRGARIQNADRYFYPYGRGPLTPSEILAYSNNVGAAKIALELGPEKLYDMFKRFGFGAPTGIEISGEANGVVWNPTGPNASGELTTAQNAFGQGLSVTAVQLVAGYAALANGGNLVTPHLVAGWTDIDGNHTPVATPPAERIMREEVADTVLELLVEAIDDGIASGASLAGYAVAGKTGTAQIAGPAEVERRDGEDEDGNPRTSTITLRGYIDGWIDSSFIGMVPASDPQLVVLILLHRPATWGRHQMMERPDVVFARLAPQLLDYLAIPPDRLDAPVARP
jgi:cell division protein FtsI/penicillin-binding protein 2